MSKVANPNLPPGTTGLILHRAARYDLIVWLLTFGRERAFREAILRPARLQPGESVLDVGCGTGSLAIAAKRQVGLTGVVHGIDASPEMIARADRKAARAGFDVVFRNAGAQTLPFGDAQFDAVLTTLVLHHLPRKAREQCAREIRRVLEPGGRVLAVDFAAPTEKERRPLFHRHRHGHVDVDEIGALFSGAGFAVVDSGGVGFRNLQFVLGVPKAEDNAAAPFEGARP
jgi:ubiquinone/menaquinone biosynthesis C-methylase UbiE